MLRLIANLKDLQDGWQIRRREGILFVEDSFDKFHTADVFKNEMTVLRAMPWNAVNALAASEKFRPQTSYMTFCADRYACTRKSF